MTSLTTSWISKRCLIKRSCSRAPATRRDHLNRRLPSSMIQFPPSGACADGRSPRGREGAERPTALADDGGETGSIHIGRSSRQFVQASSHASLREFHLGSRSRARWRDSFSSPAAGPVMSMTKKTPSSGWLSKTRRDQNRPPAASLAEKSFRKAGRSGRAHLGPTASWSAMAPLGGVSWSTDRPRQGLHGCSPNLEKGFVASRIRPRNPR